MGDTDVETTVPAMTDEQVQSLDTEQMIQMVADGAEIPYEQMTDEQLDIMEDKPKVEDDSANTAAVDNQGDNNTTDTEPTKVEAPAQPTPVKPKSNSSAAMKFRMKVDDGKSNCKVCSKKVYETEKVTLKDDLYHNFCFRCAQCNSTLRVTNYCMSVNGQIYCKPHFAQLFKVKGSYNIESNSNLLKSRYDESQKNAEQTEPSDMAEEEDVALPDLKSLKSRFESAANGNNQEMLVIDREGTNQGSARTAPASEVQNSGDIKRRMQMLNEQDTGASPAASTHVDEDLKAAQSSGSVSSLKNQWANMATQGSNNSSN